MPPRVRGPRPVFHPIPVRPGTPARGGVARGLVAAGLAAAGLALVLGGRPASASPPRVPASAPEVQPWALGRLYLKLRSVQPDGRAKPSPGLARILGASLETARTLAQVRPGEKLPAGLERLFEFRLPESTDVPALAAKLSRLPEVEYAEPVRIY